MAATEGWVMSILKARGLPRSDKPAEIEGSIRELVRRETAPFDNRGI